MRYRLLKLSYPLRVRFRHIIWTAAVKRCIPRKENCKFLTGVAFLTGCLVTWSSSEIVVTLQHWWTYSMLKDLCSCYRLTPTPGKEARTGSHQDTFITTAHLPNTPTMLSQHGVNTVRCHKFQTSERRRSNHTESTPIGTPKLQTNASTSVMKTMSTSVKIMKNCSTVVNDNVKRPQSFRTFGDLSAISSLRMVLRFTMLKIQISLTYWPQYFIECDDSIINDHLRKNYVQRTRNGDVCDKMVPKMWFFLCTLTLSECETVFK